MAGIEPEFKGSFERTLLRILLHKYENSRAFRSGSELTRPPRCSMADAAFRDDYFDEMDFRKRQWMNEVLIDLEKAGIVRVRWERFREGEAAETVLLAPSGVAAAYRRAGLRPKSEKLERLKELLRPLSDHPWPEVRAWRDAALRRMAESKTAPPELDADDPEAARDLVAALAALPQAEARPTLKRLFSLHVYRDSKRFEQSVEARLVGLLRRLRGLDDVGDEDVLDSVGIMRAPKPVLLAGPVRLRAAGRTIDLAGFADGTALFPETVFAVEAVEGDVDRIVTIENLTSYYLWVRHRAGGPGGDGPGRRELAVYTGGFPGRTLQRFFDALASWRDAAGLRRRPDVWHWGDIDLGGIRIAAFLRERWFPDLVAVKMDRDTLFAHRTEATPLSSAYARRVREALDAGTFAGWRDVLGAMLELGVRLEQEVVEAWNEI